MIILFIIIIMHAYTSTGVPIFPSAHALTDILVLGLILSNRYISYSVMYADGNMFCYSSRKGCTCRLC